MRTHTGMQLRCQPVSPWSSVCLSERKANKIIFRTESSKGNFTNIKMVVFFGYIYFFLRQKIICSSKQYIYGFLRCFVSSYGIKIYILKNCYGFRIYNSLVCESWC